MKKYITIFDKRYKVIKEINDETFDYVPHSLINYKGKEVIVANCISNIIQYGEYDILYKDSIVDEQFNSKVMDIHLLKTAFKDKIDIITLLLENGQKYSPVFVTQESMRKNSIKDILK